MTMILGSQKAEKSESKKYIHTYTRISIQKAEKANTKPKTKLKQLLSSVCASVECVCVCGRVTGIEIDTLTNALGLWHERYSF